MSVVRLQFVCQTHSLLVAIQTAYSSKVWLREFYKLSSICTNETFLTILPILYVKLYIEMSAFSAVIFLKTSFTRDKSGMPIFPSSSTPALSAKLVPEESENHELKQRLSQLEAAYEEESCNLKIKEMNSGTLPIVRERSQQG